MDFGGVVQGSSVFKADEVASMECVFYIHLSLRVKLFTSALLSRVAAVPGQGQE